MTELEASVKEVIQMKYYYGNDYKEAHTNAPIEITSVEQLRQYTENYNVVFPADDEIDLVLEEVDYTETKDGIAVDKFIFDDYRQGTCINIQFADDNEDENVYSYKMINEDDEKIYFEFIG